jgi:hypothetical protein
VNAEHEGWCGEDDILGAVQWSQSIHRISRATGVERYRYGKFCTIMVSICISSEE